MCKFFYLFLSCIFISGLHSTEVINLDLVVQQTIEKNKKLMSVLSKKSGIDVSSFRIKMVKVKDPSVIAVNTNIGSTSRMKIIARSKYCNMTNSTSSGMMEINKRLGSVKVKKQIKVYTGPKSGKYALAYSSKGEPLKDISFIFDNNPELMIHHAKGILTLKWDSIRHSIGKNGTLEGQLKNFRYGSFNIQIITQHMTDKEKKRRC